MGRDTWPVRVAIRPEPYDWAGITRNGRAVVTTDPAGAATAWDLTTGRPHPEGEVGLRRAVPAASGRSVFGVSGDHRFRSDLVQVDGRSGKVLARRRDVRWGDVAPAGRSAVFCRGDGTVAIHP